MRQKQVDAALLRAMRGAPPRGKCRAVFSGGSVHFFHYQHLVLVRDLARGVSTHRWHEKPTDLRILLAAEAALCADEFARPEAWDRA